MEKPQLSTPKPLPRHEPVLPIRQPAPKPAPTLSPKPEVHIAPPALPKVEGPKSLPPIEKISRIPRDPMAEFPVDRYRFFKEVYIPTEVIAPVPMPPTEIETVERAWHAYKSRIEITRANNGVFFRAPNEYKTLAICEDRGSIVCDENKNIHTFAIADGVSGCEFGDQAAQLAVDEAIRYLIDLENTQTPQERVKNLPLVVQTNVRAVYEDRLRQSGLAEVEQEASLSPKRKQEYREALGSDGSGITTLISGTINKNILHLSCVADGRAAVISKDGIVKFATRVGAEDDGYTGQLGFGKRQTERLTNLPDMFGTFDIELFEGDVIFACSDGLAHTNPDDRRPYKDPVEVLGSHIAAGKTIEEAVREIFHRTDLAYDDNSVLAFTYHEQPKKIAPIPATEERVIVRSRPSLATQLSAEYDSRPASQKYRPVGSSVRENTPSTPETIKPPQGLSAEDRKTFDKELETLNQELKRIERGEISFDSEVQKMRYINERCMDVHMVGVNLLPSGDTKRNYWYLHEIEQKVIGQIEFRLLYDAFKRLHPGYVEEIIAGIVYVNTEEDAQKICDATSRRFEADFYTRVLRRNLLETGRQSDVPSFNHADSEEYDACRDALQFVGNTLVKQGFATAK